MLQVGGDTVWHCADWLKFHVVFLVERINASRKTAMLVMVTKLLGGIDLIDSQRADDRQDAS